MHTQARAAENPPASTAALEEFLLDSIPLARAMQLRIREWSPARLVLTAPLAPNINDKGCAFGGSLASLATLAPWALLELALRAEGLAADIFVADATIRYLAPIWEDIRVEAEPAAGAELAEFIRTLRTRGRARIAMQARVCAAEAEACVQEARFVAKLRAD